MQVACQADQLAAALRLVTRALPARTTIPALGTVLLEAAENQLFLTATNLELTIRLGLEVAVAAEGSVAVPGKVLAEFVNAIGDEAVGLSLEPGRERLTLRSASFRTTLHGLPAGDFPPRQGAGGGWCLQLPAKGLVDAIAETIVATSSDEARPVFTGIHVGVDGDRLALSAVDGYRLARRHLDLGWVEKPRGVQVTVPARTMAEAARAFRDVAGDVRLLVSALGNQVAFETSGVALTSRVIDGPSPDYRALIPASSDTVATVAGRVLSHRLRALSPFAEQASRAVRLTAHPGGLTLSAAAPEVGSAETELPAAVTGPEVTVMLNARYLVDCPVLDGPASVDLHINGPLSPLVVRRTKADDYVYLVMPIRQAAGAGRVASPA